MAQTKDIARSGETAPSEGTHGLLDWLPRRGWLNAFEQAFETTPMRIEERIADDHYVVRAEMPGIDPAKDVEITVSDGMLQIRAERHHETKHDHDQTRRSEFHYGYFSRVVSLPAGATQGDVKATYHDGILEVRLPIDHGKTEATRVPITRV